MSIESSKLLSQGWKECPAHGFYKGYCSKCGNGVLPPVPDHTPIHDRVPVEDCDKEPDDAYDGLEKDLHNDFEKDMLRRGCVTIHCQTNKAATIGRGKPDFHILFHPTYYVGQCLACAVEFKTKGNTLSDVQKEEIADMRSKGIPVKVAYNLKDAILFARDKLGC